MEGKTDMDMLAEEVFQLNDLLDPEKRQPGLSTWMVLAALRMKAVQKRLNAILEPERQEG